MPIKAYKQGRGVLYGVIMVEFKQSLWLTFSDWRRLAIGIILSFIPIVNFMTYGYGLECARRIYGKKLPMWRYGTMWLQGLLASVIMVLYALPAFIVFSIGFFTEEFDIAVLVVSIILAVLAYYFLPMAWVSYANGRFKDAFDRSVFAKCLSSKYLATWLLVFVTGVIIAILLNFATILLSFTIVGPFLIMGFMAFWLTVFSFSVYGELYHELRW